MSGERFGEVLAVLAESNVKININNAAMWLYSVLR